MADDRESVLEAFTMEPVHDRETLTRYVEKYPDLTGDLIDLSLELRLSEAVPPSKDPIPDPGAEAAWQEFINIGKPR